MSFRKKTCLTVLVFVVLTAPVAYVTRTSPEKPSVTAAESASSLVVDEAEQARAALEEAARRTREAQRAALEAQAGARTAPTAPHGHRHDPKVIAAIGSSILDMLAVQGLYNAEATRKAMFDELVHSPQKLAVLEDTIKDEHFARTVFGERQAEARYFASQALQKAAREGNEKPLFQAVRAVARESMGGLSPGRQRDMEELLYGWASSKSEDSLERSTRDLAASLGFGSDLPAEVQTIYKDAIFMALYRRIGMDRAQSAVDRMFQG